MEMKRLKKRPSPTSISSEKVCQPCKEKLGDGIAKVTLPEGWWDYKGIGKDLTARGRKVSFKIIYVYFYFRYFYPNLWEIR